MNLEPVLCYLGILHVGLMGKVKILLAVFPCQRGILLIIVIWPTYTFSALLQKIPHKGMYGQ
jgi:uncharacterized membrane protein YqjE